MPMILLAGDLISCGDSVAAPDRGLTINGLAVAVVGDLSAGHGDFPPTPLLTGSPVLSLNGVPVGLSGDLYADHTDGEQIHAGRVGIGSGPDVTG